MRTGYTVDFLSELKAKADIVDIISSYISVEAKGNTYWARCPFHHEKTPSFAINQVGQYYKCFGCGASGDVISFVQEFESVEFMEAVKIIAQKVGMPLPEISQDLTEITKQKKRKETLLSILKETAIFYRNNLLLSEDGYEYATYLKNRNVDIKTIKRFGLGASLDMFSLVKHLKSKGFSESDCLDAGVFTKIDRKGQMVVADAYMNRLMFPIINASGEVVAFSGRTLKKQVDFAKYKNTKETPVFSKSKILYNLNQVKKLKQENGLTSIIVVEGQMDTISLVGAGIENVVASMGTAFTPDHARALKRYTENVFICYDGDFAGQKATLRGLEILVNEGLNVKIVLLPEGMDPDDFIKAKGQEGFKKLLDTALPLIDYKLHVLAQKYDLEKIDEKRAYVKEALSIIKTENSVSIREELLKGVRDRTGITFESLLRDLENSNDNNEKEKKVVVSTKSSDSGDVKASRFVLSAFLFNKRYTAEYELREIEFENETLSKIKDFILSFKRGELKPSSLYEYFDEKDEEVNAVISAEAFETEEENAEKYFIDSFKKMKKFTLEKNIDMLNLAYKETDDIMERKNIARLLQDKMFELKKLK